MQILKKGLYILIYKHKFSTSGSSFLPQTYNSVPTDVTKFTLDSYHMHYRLSVGKYAILWHRLQFQFETAFLIIFF